MPEPTFFCVYGGQEFPGSERTLEHIVPYAIGGTGEFGTRDVSAKANSDVGSIADSLLIKHPLITIERWRLQLRAQSGEIPSVTFRGTINIGGEPVNARYDIRHDGTVELRTTPSVESDWANRQFQIRCDPKDLSEILDNVVNKGQKRGLPASPESIRAQSFTQARVEQPTLSAEMSFGLFDLCPGFVKMALGTGHFIFGEAWSRSSDADLLRAVINENDPERRNSIPLHGQVWPHTSGLDPLRLNCHTDDDTHVLVVLNQKPVTFYALLFGRIDAVIQLAEQPIEDTALPPGKGAVFVICCKSRQVTNYDWDEFLVRQMTAKGWLQSPSKSDPG